MPKPATDGSGFVAERDAVKLEGESEAFFKGLVKMWVKIEIEDHPNWFDWQLRVWDKIHTNLPAIAGLYFEYAKRGGSAAKSPTEGFTMSQREWVQFVKDMKLPIPITEINDVFRRVDRADKEEREKNPKAKNDKQMVLAEFLEALTRAAVKWMNVSKQGKQDYKDGKTGEWFERLIDEYVLPLGERDVMKEWREHLASAEMDEVLAPFKPKLQEKFAEIVARTRASGDQGKKDSALEGKKGGPAKAQTQKGKAFEGKANEKQNKKAAAEGAELDGPAAVVKDLEMCKLLLDIKCVVENPVTGERPLIYMIELSRMDVERGFIESQNREEALEAIVSGNTSKLADSNELNLEEFYRCIAFCGLNMFRNVKEMPPTDRVQTLLEIYVGDPDKATPADRIRATVKKVLSKGLVRFNPSTDLSPEEVGASSVSEEFIAIWSKMILDDCHGWPLWEKELFLLLSSKYEDLYSIFTFYAKSGGVGTSSTSGFMLQQQELTNLALDCQLPTPDFAMARIQLIWKMSDQGDKKLSGDAAVDLRHAATGSGDRALEIFEFFEVLVRLSLQRQNPKLGSVGFEHTVEQPLPGCLEYVLNEHIIKLAKKDSLKEVLDALKVDKVALAHFETHKKRLKKAFEELALKTRDGSRMFAQVMLTPLVIVQDYVDRKCTKDTMVTPTPAVTGDDVRPRHSNLSQLDVKGAVTTAQDKSESTGNAGSNYDEWCMCLGLCGHIKYEEISEMSLAQRVEGMILNYLGEKDEHAVISDCLYPPLPRYDVSNAKPLMGEETLVFKNFVACWKSATLRTCTASPCGRRRSSTRTMRSSSD